MTKPVDAQVDFTAMVSALGEAVSDSFGDMDNPLDSKPKESWDIPDDPDDKIINVDNDIPGDVKTDPDATKINNTKTSPSNDINSIEDASFVVDYLNFLKEGGVISTEVTDEEINDILSKATNENEGQLEVLKYVQEKELNSHKSNIKAEYDNYAKEYVELREQGFSNSEATDMIANLEVLEGISDDSIESDEDLRKQLISEYYRATMTKPDETKIAKLVKRAIDSGDDIEEAKESKIGLIDLAKESNSLKVKEAIKIKEKAKNDEIAYKESIKKFTEELNEIIPGQKINSVTKNKLVDLVTNPISKTSDGKALNAFWTSYMSNPAKTEVILAYLNDIGAFKGNLDKINKVAETTAASKLQKKLGNMGNTRFSVNSPGSTEPTGIGKGIIEAFEKAYKNNEE